MWKAHFSPAQPNTSVEGLASNRRVEINFKEIIPKKDIWDMPVQEFKITACKAYRLHTKNGCKLTIKPGSFKVDLADTVSVLVTEYNDPTDFLAGGLPMSFNKNREEFMYQSEQMMKIEAIVNEKPVELLQMIGLECPNVDILEGLRLYKFHGEKESFVDIQQKRMTGIIEEIDEDDLTNQDLDETEEPNNDKAPTNKTKEEDADNASVNKNSGSNQSTTEFDKKQASKGKQSKKQKNSKKRKAKKEKGSKGMISLSIGGGGGGGRFRLEPDTGKTFLLEPDTGKTFLIEPDTGRGAPLPPYHHTENCLSLLEGGNNIKCDLDSFKKILEFGLALKDAPMPISPKTDLNLYYTRYKSPAYHGMHLKCLIDSNQLTYLDISIKKRFLCRKFVLKFENTPNHPEYLPFKNTKWIVRYGKALRQVKKLKDIRANDFRILRFKKADYSKKSKEGYFIELKGENQMFRFSAKPKKKKKVCGSIQGI